MPLPGIAIEQYEQLATMLGLTTESVWDLATYEDEAAETLSIHQVLALSAATGIAPYDILGIESKSLQDSKPVTPKELCDALAEKRRRSGQGMDEFEGEIGWEIQGILDEPAILYDIANWKCIVDLASAVGFDPLDLLPQRNEETEQAFSSNRSSEFTRNSPISVRASED